MKGNVTKEVFRSTQSLGIATRLRGMGKWRSQRGQLFSRMGPSHTLLGGTLGAFGKGLFLHMCRFALGVWQWNRGTIFLYAPGYSFGSLH